ncbi:MAG TPA: hypothetical protein VFK37_06805 [Bacillales bacterium]|nr:hypothetical protein [Bacillales bacterium]
MMMKVLNPAPEEIRDSLVTTAVNDEGIQYAAEKRSEIDINSHALGILSNNKWNVGSFLKEILSLLKMDVEDLEIDLQKKLNASQTAGKDLVGKIAERNYFAITGIGD